MLLITSLVGVMKVLKAEKVRKLEGRKSRPRDLGEWLSVKLQLEATSTPSGIFSPLPAKTQLLHVFVYAAACAVHNQM